MKKISITMLFILIHLLPCLAQTKKGDFKIYCITEYIDGYVIKAIDTSKHDTLNIISVKENCFKNDHYQRIEIGKIYTFYFQDIIGRMAAVPPGSFTIRMKTTIVWKNGDSMKNLPVFARNTKDLYVKMEQ